LPQQDFFDCFSSLFFCCARAFRAEQTRAFSPAAVGENALVLFYKLKCAAAQRILKTPSPLKRPSSPSRGRQRPTSPALFQSEEGHGRKTAAEGFYQSGERSSTHHHGATVTMRHVEGALLTQRIENPFAAKAGPPFQGTSTLCRSAMLLSKKLITSSSFWAVDRRQIFFYNFSVLI
jgi:hypothetical protein